MIVAAIIVLSIYGILLVWMLSAPDEAARGEGTVRIDDVVCGEIAEPAGTAIDPDITCERALELLNDRGLAALSVCAGDRFLGLVTLGDFEKLQSRDPRWVYAASIMTPVTHLVCVSRNTTAVSALKTLFDCGYRRLPVIDDSNHLAGFITRDSLRRSRFVQDAPDRDSMLR